MPITLILSKTNIFKIIQFVMKIVLNFIRHIVMECRKTILLIHMHIYRDDTFTFNYVLYNKTHDINKFFFAYNLLSVAPYMETII